jgi:hypothetical protein
MWLILFKVAVAVWLIVVLWHLRSRPTFPRDLAYRVGHWESPEPGALQSVEALPPFDTLFGIRPRQRIEMLGEERPIAELVPVAGVGHIGLYALKPGKGFRISGGAGVAATGSTGQVLPEVHVRYRLQHEDSDKCYSFILDYR